MRPHKWALLLVVVSLCGGRPVFGAETDYLPDNTEWNGLSRLADLAAAQGIPTHLMTLLDWGTLTPHDVLFFLSPTHAIDQRALQNFLEQGGQVLVGDDIGDSASPLLRKLGIYPQRLGTLAANQRFRDKRHLPVAHPPVAHALTNHVEAVVTNHPTSFRSAHPGLLVFGPDQKLLVEVRVGSGRLVALADPSVLINTMLGFDGNLALANNLISELCRHSNGRILLFTGYFEQRDAPTPPSTNAANTIHRINGRIDRINDFALTKIGMHVIAVTLTGLALIGIFALLPTRRRDLDGHWISVRGAAPPSEAVAIGMQARAFAEYVDSMVADHLQAPGPLTTVDPRWILSKVEGLAGPTAALQCERWLETLNKIPYADHSAGRPPGEAIFQKLYRQSHGLFEALALTALPVAPEADDAPNDQ